MEDAWTVSDWYDDLLAVGVFDGLGGMPNGQEAAWACADALSDPATLRSAPDEWLDRLNQVARRAEGSTTAAIALLDVRSGRGHLSAVGDSPAYLHDPREGLRQLNPLDRSDRHKLTDNLGRPDMQGHHLPIAVRPGQTLVLASDGIADGIPIILLRETAGASTAVLPEVADGLIDRVLDTGAPDNATVLLARHTLPVQ